MKMFLSLLTGVCFLFSAHQLNAQSWISHHNMTASIYQSKFNSYKNQGYRLTQVDGYQVGSTTFYAAIWKKSSGPAYKTHHGMSSSTYQQKFDQYKDEGYRLVLVDGSGGTNSATYSAIWQKKAGPAMKAHHGMTAANYQQKFTAYRNQGYRLSWVSGYNIGNTAYYAAIWERTSGPAYIAHHGMTAGSYQQKFNEYTNQGYKLTHISAFNIGNTDYYAAIWEKETGVFSARHRMSSTVYQNEFNSHNSKGYKLKQVVGYARNERSQFAAIWESSARRSRR